MNIAQQVGAGDRGVDYLDGVGMDAIRAHEETSHRATRSTVCWRPAPGSSGPRTPPSAAARSRSGTATCIPHDLATVLNAEGVSVRAGHHCAQLVMRRFEVPATTRASLYLYNTTEDVDALLDGLEQAHAIFGSRLWTSREGERRGAGRHLQGSDPRSLQGPRNKRELPGANHVCTRNNPLCGDEITVAADVDDGTSQRSPSRARDARSRRARRR